MPEGTLDGEPSEVTDDLARAMRDPRYWRARDPHFIAAVMDSLRGATAGGFVQVAGLLAANAQLRREIVDAKASARDAERALAAAGPPSIETRQLGPRSLRSVAQLLKVSLPAARTPGVYFLFRSGRLIYLGQATDVFARVASHRGTKDFDRWSYVRCPAGQLNDLERAYLDALRPELNRDRQTMRLRNGEVICKETSGVARNENPASA